MIPMALVPRLCQLDSNVVWFKPYKEVELDLNDYESVFHVYALVLTSGARAKIADPEEIMT